MVRWLLALVAFALPAALAAQSLPWPKDEPITVSAVVWEMGGVYPPIGDIKTHGQSINFVAWRVDGPDGDERIRTTELWLSINTETAEEIAEATRGWRKGKLVRFEVKDPAKFHKGSGTFGVKWIKTLQPIEDAELTATAQAIFKPKPFTDPEFGEFEPHSRLIDHFGQVREWLGKKTVFEIIQDPMGPDARKRALSMARLAWKERKAIDAEIRDSVTASVYEDTPEKSAIKLVPLDGGEPITAENDDGGPKLTRTQFRDDHVLNRVSCSARDWCNFEYIVQNEEWYWSYDATIRRDEKADGGWFVSEWDFP